MKDALAFLLAIVLVILAIVGATYGYLALYRDAAPKFAAAQRAVFEQTPSYVQGKIQHLSQLQADIRRAKDEETRETLRDLARREASTIDPALLPDSLYRFVRSL